MPPPSYLQIVEVSTGALPPCSKRGDLRQYAKLITKLPYSGNTSLPRSGVDGRVVGLGDKSPTISACLSGIVVLGYLHWDRQQDTSPVVEAKTN